MRVVSGWLRSISFPVSFFYWKCTGPSCSQLQDCPCELAQPLLRCQRPRACCSLAWPASTATPFLLHTPWDCSSSHTRASLARPCHSTPTALCLLLGVSEPVLPCSVVDIGWNYGQCATEGSKGRRREDEQRR